MPVISGCGGCSRITKGPAVSAPAANASADVVVKTFLAAIIARDTNTIQKLTFPKYWERMQNDADNPLTNWINITDVSIGKPMLDTYDPEKYKYVVRVYVDFKLEQCEEMSFRNGANAWGYLLARNTERERWRIISAGMG
ncbi:hypothetical protein ACIBHX_33170 [Nonomuraea sp. NPDC050536]|uniref:hypothetical protein n=1 Tax=Nonomuraea sp. NPDC050536 TaxID=3364366 RepID=UPI0037CACCF4